MSQRAMLCCAGRSSREVAPAGAAGGGNLETASFMWSMWVPQTFALLHSAGRGPGEVAPTGAAGSGNGTRRRRQRNRGGDPAVACPMTGLSFPACHDAGSAIAFGVATRRSRAAQQHLSHCTFRTAYKIGKAQRHPDMLCWVIISHQIYQLRISHSQGPKPCRRSARQPRSGATPTSGSSSPRLTWRSSTSPPR